MKTLVSAAAFVAVGALAAGNAGAMPARSLATATSSGWTATATQGLKLVKATDFGAVSPSLQMHIVVGLRGNSAEAAKLAAEIMSPKSSNYHHYLKPAQFAALVSPSSASANAVASYLAKSGFSKVSIAPDRLIVSGYASAATVGKTFNTSIHNYAQLGKAIYANATPAMVPAALGATVLSVIGLNSIPMHTNHVASPKSLVKASMSRLVNGKVVRNVSPCETGTTLPVCALNEYYPSDLDVAYDDENSPTGAGTDEAIFTEGDLTVPISDLHQAWAADGHPQDPIYVKNVLGPATDTSGSDEWDIDSQSSTATAGNVRSVTFYNGTSLEDDSLTSTFEAFADDDTIPIVNLSVGGCEALSYVTGTMQTDDLIFAQMVIQGQAMFVSSGDGGSQCSIEINPGAPVGGPAQVEYPASSPYVTAVGGTSLLTNSATGTYYGEIAWEDGGGGISYFENAAPWQYSNIELAQAGKRVVPDIAMDADPNVSGMNTIVAGAYSGYGGTSLASPLSMGVFARLESRHGNSLGIAASTLYTAYNAASDDSEGILPNESLPSGLTQNVGGFNDILTGTNSVYDATPGFDLTTGIGSLDINRLIIAYGS